MILRGRKAFFWGQFFDEPRCFPPRAGAANSFPDRNYCVRRVPLGYMRWGEILADSAEETQIACRCDYGKNLLFERAVSAYYYEGTGRTLLQNFKFKGDRACYDQILSRRFLERTASAFSGVPFDYIVPVPMYEREKDRFDQTLYLARSLSRKMGIPCRTDLLRKVQKTPPQHLQKAKDRGENVKGAFLACKKNDLQGVCILLVDDVATTFSTLNACTAALKAAGADRVLCACLMTTAGRTKNQGDAK